MEKSDLRRRNRPCCGQSKSKTSGQISKGKLCRDITEKLDNRNGSVGVTKSPKEEEEEISSVHYLSLTLPYITSGGDHSFQRGNNRSEKNELDDNPPSIITASDTGSEEMISATSGQTALTKDRVQETIRCFANIDWHLKRANTMPHIGQSTKDTPVNVDFVMESTKEEISFFAKSKIQAGKLDEAVDIFDSVLDYYRPRSGKNNLFVALALHNLCVINIWNGNFERALIYGQEALRVRRELYGSNHISIVSSLCELGVIYYAKEEFNRSLSSFREALQLKYKAMGGDDIDVSSILNNIGCVHYSLGKLVTSEATFQEALNLQKRCLGSVKSEHADRALLDMSINLCNMALVAEKMSKLDDAQSLLEEGLMVQQSVLADTHRIVLGTKSLLSCLQNDGKLEDCRLNIDISMPYRLEKKPEQKRKRTYEKRRVHLNCTKNIDMVSLGPVPNGMKTIHKVSLPFNNECLANVLLAEGKKKNESWVDLDSPYQERNHYDTNLYQLCEKASKLIQNRKSDEAVRILDLFVESHKNKYGEVDYTIGTLHHIMGTIHLFSTRFRSALKEFNAAVKIRSKVLAHDHIDVFSSLIRGAIAMLALKDYDGSLAIFQKVLRQKRKKYGYTYNDPTFAMIVNNIGVCHFEFGGTLAAVKAFEESVEIQRTALQRERSLVDKQDIIISQCKSLNNLAFARYERGENSEAIIALEERVTLLRDLYDDDHSEVRSSVKSLAHVMATANCQDNKDKIQQMTDMYIDMFSRG